MSPPVSVLLGILATPARGMDHDFLGELTFSFMMICSAVTSFIRHSITFTCVLSTGMAEPKMTKRGLSVRREKQIARHIKKAIRDGEIPKARKMIGKMVRDSITNTCL